MSDVTADGDVYAEGVLFYLSFDAVAVAPEACADCTAALGVWWPDGSSRACADLGAVPANPGESYSFGSLVAGPVAAGTYELQAALFPTTDCSDSSAAVTPVRAIGEFEAIEAPVLAVVQLTPPPDAANVPVGTAIAVRFQDTLVANSLGDVTLTTGGVPIEVDVAVSGPEVQITPTQTLEGSSRFTVTLGAGLESVRGLSLDADVEWNFTTGS